MNVFIVQKWRDLRNIFSVSFFEVLVWGLILVIDNFLVLRKLRGVNRVHLIGKRFILKIKGFIFLLKFLRFFYVI